MTRGVRLFPKTQRHSSWEVIYMDLMTIMMVFFVILWSLNKGKDDGISETVGTETPRMIQLSSDILFEPRKVQVGFETGRYVTIVHGLSEGDTVVTTGSFLLKTEILKGSIGAGCCEVDFSQN